MKEVIALQVLQIIKGYVDNFSNLGNKDQFSKKLSRINR